jgi:bacillithiol synthase
LTGRDINLFYIDGDLRERITIENGLYKVLNTDITFTEAQITALAKSNPEKFSPNVVLRPVYQETILPNIAYLGGPSECTYWLQLKGVFDTYQVQYPVVLPRNFAMYVSGPNAQKLQKNQLSLLELFQDDQTIKEIFLQRNADELITFDEQKQQIATLFNGYLSKALLADKSLEGAVLAERQKTISSIENLEKRIKKSEEKRFEVGLNQLAGVKAKLFPDGEPQERVESFMSISLNNPDFIEQLFQNFNPLDFSYLTFTEA